MEKICEKVTPLLLRQIFLLCPRLGISFTSRTSSYLLATYASCKHNAPFTIIIGSPHDELTHMWNNISTSDVCSSIVVICLTLVQIDRHNNLLIASSQYNAKNWKKNVWVAPYSIWLAFNYNIGETNKEGDGSTFQGWFLWLESWDTNSFEKKRDLVGKLTLML